MSLNTWIFFKLWHNKHIIKFSILTILKWIGH
jgi:hypothetical protein